MEETRKRIELLKQELDLLRQILEVKKAIADIGKDRKPDWWYPYYPNSTEWDGGGTKILAVFERSETDNNNFDPIGIPDWCNWRVVS